MDLKTIPKTANISTNIAYKRENSNEKKITTFLPAVFHHKYETAFKIMAYISRSRIGFCS
jgi:hypothetical protein